MASVSLKLFGSPAIFGVANNNTFPTKGFQLLAFLSLAPNFTAARAQLAQLLWQADSDEKALGSLRQLLARIRRVSPDQPIFDSTASHVALAEPMRDNLLTRLWSVGEHMGGLSSAELLQLFEGELLEGMDAAASEEFSVWLTRIRAQAREKLLAIASDRLFRLTRFGGADEGEIDRIGAQMLEIDPEREESYRVLLEAFGRNGQIAKARKTFEDLQEMLRTEYGSEPDAETAKIARRVFASARAKPLGLEQPLDTSVPKAPRVAFMMPAWICDDASKGYYRALVADIAGDLSRYRSFVVLGPHTSLKIDHEFGTPLDNSVLQADYAISGFVRQSRGYPVMALTLSKCGLREIIWSAEFAFSEADLIDANHQLSQRIVASLAAAIESDRTRALRSTDEPNAYVSLLSAIDTMAVCDLPYLRRARKHLSVALELDAGFAAAHAANARCMLFEWLILGASQPEVILAARNSAINALELDPNDGLIHGTLASIEMYRHDVDASLSRFREAESLSPNSGELLVGYATALSTVGKPETGLDKFERAIELNPLMPDDQWWAGASIAFDAHQYQRAIDYCGKMKTDDAVLRILTACHALVGDIAKAKSYGARLRENYPNQTAAEMVGITPIQNKEVYERFLEGLRLAGIK